MFTDILFSWKKIDPILDEVLRSERYDDAVEVVSILESKRATDKVQGKVQKKAEKKIEKGKKGCEAQFSQAVRLVQRNKPERLRSMGAREVIDSMRESNIAVSTGCVCMVRAYRRNEWTTAEKVSVLEWLL